jgi:uncharacterized protein involved in type VI secretion and phage assembly
MEDLGGHVVGTVSGVITSTADPLKIGRVRVRVLGLFEPESGWILPKGMPGSGESGRGMYFVPKEGAEVCVDFIHGDIDNPRWSAGNWGAPNGQSQAPGPVGSASAEEAPKIFAIETDSFLIVVDDRAGQEKFEIKHKSSGDGITYEGTTRAMEIKSTTALNIKATGAIKIDALAITINNRVVLPGPKPI